MVVSIISSSGPITSEPGVSSSLSSSSSMSSWRCLFLELSSAPASFLTEIVADSKTCNINDSRWSGLRRILDAVSSDNNRFCICIIIWSLCKVLFERCYFCIDYETKTGAPHGVLVSVIFQASIALQNLNKNVRYYIPTLNSFEEVYKMSRIRIEIEEVRVNIRASISLNVVGHQD